MSTPAVLIATAKVGPEDLDAFTAWQTRHNKVIARFPGFLSSDLIPPGAPGVPGGAAASASSAGAKEWTFILNFATQEQLVHWQKSPERAALFTEALPFFTGGSIGEIMQPDSNAATPSTVVTQVIVSQVKSGMEDQYREWAVRMQAAQSRFPGYGGMYLQPPTSGQGNHWTTLLRFDTAAHMDAWMASSERDVLLTESKAFIQSEELMRLATSFPGWVPMPVAPAGGKAPPDWKPAMLVLLGLFPVVMLEMKYLSPILSSLGLHASMATFIGNVLSVAITSFGTMPPCVKLFGWWLFPKEDTTETMLKGVAILCLLFAVEIAAMWNMLPW